MSNSGHNPLRYIETLPPPARVDLIEFIESSAEASVTDEAEYLLGVLELHRRRFGRGGRGS